jgi:hypothetical protein
MEKQSQPCKRRRPNLAYVNLITIVIIVIEKKRRHYFRTDLHILHKRIFEFITKLLECVSLLLNL